MNILVVVSKRALVIVNNLSDGHVVNTSQIEQAFPRFKWVWRLLATRGELLVRDSWVSTHMYMLMQSCAVHRTLVYAFVEQILVD